MGRNPPARASISNANHLNLESGPVSPSEEASASEVSKAKR